MGAYEYNSTPTSVASINARGNRTIAYPNPVTSNYVNIRLDDEESDSAIVRIIDLNGMVVSEKLTQQMGVINIPVTVKPGVYILQIVRGSKMDVERIVVR
jgi:hypothetical protein